MHKVKPGALTSGTVKINVKETIESYFARDNTSILETVSILWAGNVWKIRDTQAFSDIFNYWPKVGGTCMYY